MKKCKPVFAMGDVKPMSEAPKDGRAILAFSFCDKSEIICEKQLVAWDEDSKEFIFFIKADFAGEPVKIFHRTKPTHFVDLKFDYKVDE